MNALTAIFEAAPDALAKLRIRTDDQVPPRAEMSSTAGSMWDNRPSWDNWQKHR